jgi:hypothetical protein
MSLFADHMLCCNKNPWLHQPIPLADGRMHKHAKWCLYDAMSLCSMISLGMQQFLLFHSQWHGSKPCMEHLLGDTQCDSFVTNTPPFYQEEQLCSRDCIWGTIRICLSIQISHLGQDVLKSRFSFRRLTSSLLIGNLKYGSTEPFGIQSQVA